MDTNLLLTFIGSCIIFGSIICLEIESKSCLESLRFFEAVFLAFIISAIWMEYNIVKNKQLPPRQNPYYPLTGIKY